MRRQTFRVGRFSFSARSDGGLFGGHEFAKYGGVCGIGDEFFAFFVHHFYQFHNVKSVSPTLYSYLLIQIENMEGNA